MSSVFVSPVYILPDNFKSVALQVSLYVFVNDLNLSRGEISALSHFYISGINEETEKAILSADIFGSVQSLKNLKTKLVKMGIIYKDSGKYVINNLMNVGVADKIAINLRAGNR